VKVKSEKLKVKREKWKVKNGKKRFGANKLLGQNCCAIIDTHASPHVPRQTPPIMLSIIPK
jgi:hypothetical protein